MQNLRKYSMSSQSPDRVCILCKEAAALPSPEKTRPYFPGEHAMLSPEAVSLQDDACPPKDKLTSTNLPCLQVDSQSQISARADGEKQIPVSGRNGLDR